MEKENDISKNILNLINESKEPPYTLVLNRKSIQKFSGGPKIALYYCDKLKKYFSFTFDEISINENFITKLENIEDITEILFSDGSTLNINKDCAEPIISFYEIFEDKTSFQNYISYSSDNFLNTLNLILNG